MPSANFSGEKVSSENVANAIPFAFRSPAWVSG